MNFSNMSGLSRISNAVSRSLSAENPTGEKGKGAMAEIKDSNHAARELGRGWKVSPSINIKPGEVYEIANVDGPGIIKHIWMTHGCKYSRKLILRMYWDQSDSPSVEVPLCDFFACADCRVTTDEERFTTVNSLLYRWHICDPVYFKKDIKVTMQALGWRDQGRFLPLQDDISSVAFWYRNSICKAFPKLPVANEPEII